MHETRAYRYGHGPLSPARNPAVPLGTCPGPAPGRVSGLFRRRAQDPEVAPAAYLDPLPHRLCRGTGRASLPDDVGECFQVIGLRRRGLLGLHRQPYDVPAAWCREPAGVVSAQIVTVRLDVGGQWPEYRGGVAVDISERVDRCFPASRPGTPTRHHQPASPSNPRRAHLADGIARTLTRADRTDMRQPKPPPRLQAKIVSSRRAGDPVAARMRNSCYTTLHNGRWYHPGTL